MTTNSCIVLDPVLAFQWWMKVMRSQTLWSTCGGDYRLMFAMMHRMAANPKFDGTFRVSQRDLKLDANINSNSLLEKMIERLVDRGLIKVLDPGEADLHDGTGRARGRAARYEVRFQGSTSHSVVEELQYLKKKKGCRCTGGPRNPDSCDNWDLQQQFIMLLGPLEDLEDDRVADEPHILRLRHMVNDDEPEINGPTLMGLLGLARSTAFEVLRRWKEKGLIVHGRFVKLNLAVRTKDRFSRLRTVIARETLIRAEALAGRYVNKKMRMLQRRVFSYGSTFMSYDLDACARVAREQQRKADVGDLPWLDPGELLAAIVTPCMTP